MTVCIIIAAVAALFLMICFAAYLKAFYHKGSGQLELPRSKQYSVHKEEFEKMTAEYSKIKWENATVKARDNTKLCAEVLDQGSKICQIQMHGYKSSPNRDFCGGAPLAAGLGHNLIVPYQRAHFSSGSRTITFGIREADDVKVWVDYAKKRFGEDVKIILCGVSMGAATVITAVGLEPDERVVGVVADCPYSSPKGIIKKVCSDMGLPSGIAYPFAWMGALIFGRLRIKKQDGAMYAVKNSRLPILLMHGDDDRFVPVGMSKQIKEANPDKVRLEIFRGAGHGLCYMCDPERYKRLVREFCEEVTEK